MTNVITQGKIEKDRKKLFGMLPVEPDIPSPKAGQIVQLREDGGEWINLDDLTPGQRRFGNHTEWRVVLRGKGN